MTAHGQGASVLVLVIDTYDAFDRALAQDAKQNPKLIAVLGAVDAAIKAIPQQ